MTATDWDATDIDPGGGAQLCKCDIRARRWGVGADLMGSGDARGIRVTAIKHDWTVHDSASLISVLRLSEGRIGYNEYSIRCYTYTC